MPTNLPPNAQEAERRYREAETTEEKIATLEEYISLIPKHKGTDHLRADLRRKLSKLKEAAQSQKKTGKQASPFHIDREGSGQVVVLGMTNVGKSSLVVALTNAEPQVSEAPYTTWEPMPGMMPVEDIQVQLIDTPPLNPEFIEPELFNLMRRADLVLLVVDVQADPLRDLAEASALLAEQRLAPLHRRDCQPEDSRTHFKPMLVLANKCDDEAGCENLQILRELLEEPWPLLAVSAETGRNLDQLRRWVFEALGIIRIYSKAPGKEPDLGAPYVMKAGATIDELARRVHRDFYENLKQARVWGSADFEGQPVGRDYVLQDGDIVELRM
jgi:hypothetical protein